MSKEEKKMKKKKKKKKKKKGKTLLENKNASDPIYKTSAASTDSRNHTAVS
jgi:hypothetical protein